MNYRLLIVTLFLGLCKSAFAQLDEKVKLVHQYLEEETTNGNFSGNVLINYKGQVMLNKTYGLANKEWNVENTIDTKFRIGSVSKQFTASAILVLEQQNKLSVNDKVDRFIPDFPRGNEITVHHLLTHTSGLVDLTSKGVLPSLREKLSIEEVIQKFWKLPLDFVPGAKYKYSNSGYVVLAKIIEMTSGTTFDFFLNENIFKPSGMSNTFSDDNRLILPSRADGYSIKEGEFINADFIEMMIPKGGGSLVSTTHDLFLWNQALTSNIILTEQSKTKMLTPFHSNYGYGVNIKTLHDRNVVMHTGGINGFSATFIRFPDENSCIIILSNYEFAHAGQMGIYISDLMYRDQ